MIECIYCKSNVSLYYINNHLKGKKCKYNKELYQNLNPDKDESEFILYLNVLKKNAIYNKD